MKSYNILGVMSGTSLDGLDLCLVQFKGSDYDWSYSIQKAQTIKYNADWQKRLSNLTTLNGFDLSMADRDFGHFIGEQVNGFLKSKIDYIASHGHTVFHQPQLKHTLQIGCGSAILAETGIPVVYDFRSLDVALGGQGAPLVPIGDQHLFREFVSCINFGGIANLSYQKNNDRVAYDICPVNMALNELANELNLPYDDQGNNAKKGQLLPELLSTLNKLDYYYENSPKSLGIEWYDKYMKPLIGDLNLDVYDRLYTVCEHISIQVSSAINDLPAGKVLLTGGGAYNTHLIDAIQNKTAHQLIIPSNELVEYKEALVFAFLGLLKIEGKTNVLKSVTGSLKDSSSGVIAS